MGHTVFRHGYKRRLAVLFMLSGKRKPTGRLETAAGFRFERCHEEVEDPGRFRVTCKVVT